LQAKNIPPMAVPNDFNPSKSHPLYFIRKGLYNKIREYQSKLTGRLLDFGCGAKPYKSLFTGLDEYIGVDYAQSGHSGKYSDTEFFYDGKTLPFPNESFDSAFSSEVFEHIFNLDEILPELHRVLKPGSRILITCPFVWEEHEEPFDYARYSKFALADMLEKYGFEIEVYDKSGDFVTALHQLFILYLNDHWIHRVWFLSRIQLFKKCVRQLLIPSLNYVFIFCKPLWPINTKLYLNNIVVAKKTECKK